MATTVIVGFGFLGMAFSASLAGTARFGYLAAAAIFVALVATLLLLAALLLQLWRTESGAAKRKADLSGI